MGLIIWASVAGGTVLIGIILMCIIVPKMIRKNKQKYLRLYKAEQKAKEESEAKILKVIEDKSINN